MYAIWYFVRVDMQLLIRTEKGIRIRILEDLEVPLGNGLLLGRRIKMLNNDP